jgi:hypothetical protein
MSIILDKLLHKEIKTFISFTRHTWLRRLLLKYTDLTYEECSRLAGSLIEVIIENKCLCLFFSPSSPIMGTICYIVTKRSKDCRGFAND